MTLPTTLYIDVTVGSVYLRNGSIEQLHRRDNREYGMMVIRGLREVFRFLPALLRSLSVPVDQKMKRGLGDLSRSPANSGRSFDYRDHKLAISFCFLAALSASGLANCTSGATEASEDSEFLQNAVVPEIISWAATDSSVMPLAQRLNHRRYDLICIVPEYGSTSRVEQQAGEIGQYHGSRGRVVPEGNVAIVAVRGAAAHVAYLRLRDVTLLEPPSRCATAAAARIRRLSPTRLQPITPLAVLETAK
jgi:hypothetical protein